MTKDEVIRELEMRTVGRPKDFRPFISVGQLQSLLDVIKKLPIEKTGHWAEGQTNNPNMHNILCSCCLEGYPSKGHANSQYTREKYKYCPNCGSYMREEEE